MRGATKDAGKQKKSQCISIHAPHARSDLPTPPLRLAIVFQSTLLMRGATRALHICQRPDRISIHAPHARSDGTHRRVAGADSHFNPRSSCEERPQDSSEFDVCKFISIHAPHARSDMGDTSPWGRQILISIHAPHARSDCATLCGRLCARISIHAPHARSDWPLCSSLRHRSPNFNPRSSCEERRRQKRPDR